MKPTWEGWADVRAAQQEDVTSYSDCLYSGRWTEHDDVDWYDWQKVIDLPGQTIYPISWDHCVDEQSADYDLTTRLWLDGNSVMLWNPTTDRQEEPYDTIWTPVEYPN
ncbi:MAG: hypothetical protein VW907_07460 [Opitutae bacterium]|jgi:hypothetical protein